MVQSNCYIVGCRETNMGIIIDPGDEPDRILAEVDKSDLRIVQMLNTHGHFDHVMAVDPVRQALGVTWSIHQGDLILLSEMQEMVKATWGIDIPPSPHPDGFVRAGDTITFGNQNLAVIHTPGHSPGGVCFYSADAAVLISGDTLFRRGIGRYDLPGADGTALFQSITEKLFTLPDEVTVYPGHGPPTTIGEERRLNPFLQ
ncbi:MAG: MBL fold metallo-hydrolase [Chloroflexi bacterium]|nr:MBL fold metallo-hydrolase [Chloroflexota bacterium]